METGGPIDLFDVEVIRLGHLSFGFKFVSYFDIRISSLARDRHHQIVLSRTLVPCHSLILGWPGLEGEARNPGASFAIAPSSPGHPTPVLSCDKAADPIWRESRHGYLYKTV